jgi:hypothetical protein
MFAACDFSLLFISKTMNIYMNELGEKHEREGKYLSDIKRNENTWNIPTHLS